MNSSLKPETQRILAVLLPLIVIFASVMLCYPAYANYQVTLASLQLERSNLEKLRASPLPPVHSGTAAAADLPSEPPLFLEQVTEIAHSARCRMEGFEVVAVPPPVAAAPVGEKAVANSLNANDAAKAPDESKKVEVEVQPKRAKVTVAGSYPQIRDFLWRLGKADRVYVVTGLDVNTRSSDARSPAAMGGLKADITIERYVIGQQPAAGH